MLGAEVALAWRIGAFALRQRLREARCSTVAGLLGAGLLMLGVNADPAAKAAPRYTLAVRGPSQATGLDEAHVIVEANGLPVASADVGPSPGPAATFLLRRGDYTVQAYDWREGRLGSAIGAPVPINLRRNWEITLGRGSTAQ